MTTLERPIRVFSGIVPSEPLLLDAAATAQWFGKSVRTWRSWDAAGMIPAPICLGRSKYWRQAELLAWIEAGCPARKSWKYRA